MNPAPLRPDETAALAALRGLDVLDTDPESEFDALARAASVVCGTPIALISLVDADRQWFKANVGLAGVTETPRAAAFCAHAVLGESLFEVADASEDVRFRDNPLVVGAPHIRFYAGMPLHMSGGARVGTLCVIDRQPRQLDATQREVLQCLGLAAAKALEARRAMRRLAAAASVDARLAQVEAHSTDAIVGIDAAGRVTRWNPAAELLFGHSAEAIIGESVAALAPPDHASEDIDVMSRLADGKAHTYETVRRHGSGRLVHVTITAVPVFDDAGRVCGSLKFVRDMSERLQRERQEASAARARRRYDATPAMLHSMDHEGRLIAVSDRWLAVLGYERSEVIGRPAPDLMTPESRERALRVELPTLRTQGYAHDVEYQFLTRDGRLLDVLVSAVVERDDDGQPLGHVSVIQDVTEQRSAERDLARARHDLQKVLDAVPSQIGYWDRDLRNRIANVAYREWFGVEPGELKGRHMSELLGPEAYARSKDHLDAALEGRAQSFYEYEVQASDGIGKRHAHVNYLPDVVDGEVVGIYTLVHDITEGVEARRKQADSERDSVALLGTLNQHAIVSVADRRGRIIDANQAFCSISGYAREDLLGQDHRLLNSGHHDRSFWIDMWRTIAGGRAWRGDVCNRAKDGSLYWVDSIVAPFIGADGRIEKYISIRNDITERVLAKDKLERSNERFSIAASGARLGFWDFDIASNTIQWDDQMFRLYGRSTSEGLHPYTLWADSLHPEDRAATEQALGEAAGGGPPFDTEFRIVLSNGDVRHVRAVAHLMRDDSSRPRRMVGVNFDVTERAEAELALQRRESQMRLVINSFPGPLAHWDAQMRCTFANEAYRVWWGIDPLEMVGRSKPELFGERIVGPDREAIVAALKGEPQRLERFRDCADGRPRHYFLHYLPDIDGGHVRGFISAAMDVTTLKETERQLRHAVQKAEAANMAKSQFLANMSHEIRTPMNAVIGLSYVLERTTLDVDQAQTLGKIKLASSSLLNIINDVLDLSKIEAGQMELEQTPFAMDNLLSDVTALSRLHADAKGVAFTVHVASDLPRAVVGDATRLRQVLTNLLNNAVKFTERGAVKLTGEVLHVEAGRARFRFVVEDSGIGIAPDALQRLFLPFAQADASTTRRFGGTGLGLSIVKQLVTLMGGELGVDSVLDQGSAFWVELDFAVCGDSTFSVLEEPIRSTLGPGLLGVRVLVADDSTINLEVARRILELEGARVWLARDGQEAVNHLLADPEGFDVVLMDVQMPVLDGHDATRRIRTGLGLTELPVIALTAGISIGEHERAAMAGMNDVVAKPFNPQALIRCIRKHAHANVGAGVPAALPNAFVPQPEDQSPTWPQIEGIDATDVQARLGGDVELFVALLARLLDDFGDLGDAMLSTGPAQMAMRLHNLKGSAGTLGALSIQHAAAKAEQACRDRQTATAATLVGEVSDALAFLRQAAEPVLLASRNEPDSNDAGSTESLEPEALAELRQQLRQFDPSAVARFKTLAPQLKRLLGPDTFSRLQRRIDNLEFSEAVSTLDGV